MSFGINSPQNNDNNNKQKQFNLRYHIVVKSNFFRSSFGRIEDTKRHFEINCPLTQHRFLLNSNKFPCISGRWKIHTLFRICPLFKNYWENLGGPNKQSNEVNSKYLSCHIPIEIMYAYHKHWWKRSGMCV